MTDDFGADIESDSLREAELMQARAILQRLVGRTITAVRFEETRIALETDDGAIRYFYGYMGEDVPPEASAEETASAASSAPSATCSATTPP